MPDQMPRNEMRVQAVLDAMREPPPLDHEAVARVAARAVLANAPGPRANMWTMRAAAAAVVVALGAAAASAARERVPDAPATFAANTPVIGADIAMLPVVTSAARPIVFELDAPEASSVQVLGDFNHWSRDTNAMQRGADGRWRVTTMLPPGRYVYAYLVDGQRFQRDPQRDPVEDRDFGVTGSELVVGEAP